MSEQPTSKIPSRSVAVGVGDGSERVVTAATGVTCAGRDPDDGHGPNLRTAQRDHLHHPGDVRAGTVDFDTDDPTIREALVADQELRDALHAHDVDTTGRLYAPEFALNSPLNRVQTRQETIGFVANRQMRQVGATRVIEAAYRSGDDVVVIMGHESFVWGARVPISMVDRPRVTSRTCGDESTAAGSTSPARPPRSPPGEGAAGQTLIAARAMGRPSGQR